MEDNQKTEEQSHKPVLQEPAPATRKKTFFIFLEKNFLALSILFAALLIASSVFYTSGGGLNIKQTAQIKQDEQGNARVTVSVDDDSVLGNKNSSVTIIEFSDFQCPFCRSFWKETLPQIKRDYIDTGKAKFVYRDFPLSFHAGAQPAAEGAECARDQGKFWEVHDKIFQEQDKQGQGTIQFGKTDVVKWAGQIGLDISKFNQCLDSGKYKAEVEKDFNDGTSAGVSGTPSVFINGRLIVGAQPYAAFKSIIEAELKRK